MAILCYVTGCLFYFYYVLFCCIVVVYALTRTHVLWLREGVMIWCVRTHGGCPLYPATAFVQLR